MSRIRDFPLPPQLTRTARSWVSTPSAPVAARAAATIMLLRDAGGGRPTPSRSAAGRVGGPEVFIMRRVSTMEFAPSVLVFPGGGVDERDADSALP